MRRAVDLMTCYVALGLTLALCGCASLGVPDQRPAETWRGLHVYLNNRDDLPGLHRAIRADFAPRGLNVLVLEVDYQFAYESHPELRAGNPMTREDAKALLALCRQYNIQLIPQFQCFGHQGYHPGPLLKQYPELMAPPKPDYGDRRHYHTSWNPLHPKTNEIAFALIDELIEAFEPQAFHVGLDEVMLFPDETTPCYNGESHAEVFAKAVNDLHRHIVKEKGLAMLMWGDRLLDCSEMPYNRYEASDLDTASAIDMIPKDIIICDWHYLRMKDYPSIRHFEDKGFRVWPAGWRSPSASLALWQCAHRKPSPKMIGHLCTSWCNLGQFCLAVHDEELDTVHPNAQKAGRTFRAVSNIWRKSDWRFKQHCTSGGCGKQTSGYGKR